MKYVITESRLDTIIYDYIDKMFDVENINWHNPYYYDDDTGEEGEIETMVEYYIGDFDEGENICFRWYDCEYFAPNNHLQGRCPIVSLEVEYQKILDGYFGEMWHEPFKKWFIEKFDQPVKSIDM